MPSPILICTYPRTGSTTLELVLACLVGPGATVLHEPFRRYSGTDRREFNRDLDEVVETTAVLKHHPVDLLSDRQNRLLYRRWLSRGGRIVHLVRDDMWAQARSLVIARALGSFHRPHRVGRVPTQRLRAEYLDLRHARNHNSQLLSEFEHTDVSYEELFAGALATRLETLRALLADLDPAFVDSLEQRDVCEQVTRLLGPERRVRALRTGKRVSLVDQVPNFSGTIALIEPGECRALSRRLRPDRDCVAGSRGWLHGVTAVRAADVFGADRAASLRDRIVAGLHAGARVKAERSARDPMWVVEYDGDRRPDHDLDLAPEPLDTETPAVHYSLSLTGAETSGGDIHVGSRGTLRAAAAGMLTYWASNMGGRRTPVRAGRCCAIVGSLGLSPGQLLCAGQIFGDAGMFADDGQPSAGMSSTA